MLTNASPVSRTPWLSGRVAEHVAAIERQLPPTAMESAAWLRQQLQAQLDDHDAALNLYAGTNIVSDAVTALHAMALSSRPSMGWPGDKYQAGLARLEKLEVFASHALAEVMGARFAEVRSPSATMANLAVYTAMAEPGDSIATLDVTAGGHTSHQQEGVPAVRGLRVVSLPFDAQRWDVDRDTLPRFLAEHQPKLVVVGASLMLYPYELKSLTDLVHDAGSRLLYDASHVAGLIAGGRFQHPLRDGADVVVFSTYKSFGGPVGAGIVTNDEELARRISDTVYPVMTANYDAARVAPLAMRCLELLDDGPTYADACIGAARSLADALEAHGVPLARRADVPTESHHVAVDATRLGGASAVLLRLEANGILASAIHLPHQEPSDVPVGVRLGTQELVRRGQDAVWASARVADGVLATDG